MTKKSVIPEIFLTAGGCYAAVIDGKRVEGGLAAVRAAINESVDNAESPPVKRRCPGCGRINAVQSLGDLYRCSQCRFEFDDHPDEGGDYSHNPAVRLEREERRKGRRKR